jgi:ubiquinone/menaquinone biosynthesis C-methylase UbiE
MNESRIKHDHGGIKKQKQGISSILKVDSELVFKELKLKKGYSFLDIGCGSGDYSFITSKLVENSGFVYALERWEELTKQINQKIDSENIKNMKAICADITKNIPVPDNCIDVCFMAMVLHGFDLEKYTEILFNEIYRVLKFGGRLAIIEMKKNKSSDTHPEHIRLSALDIENLIKKYKFKQLNYTDLGSCYMVQFGVLK